MKTSRYVISTSTLSLLLLFLVVGIFLRFYAYSDRWYIFSDQGRDQLVGLGALHLQKIPLTGPFSSAGPFVVGPLYIFFIMGSYLLLPNMISAPQFMLILTSLFFIIPYYIVGRMMFGKKFAWIPPAIYLLSFEIVNKNTSLSNPSFLAFSVPVLFLFYLAYVKLEDARWQAYASFFMGLCFGLAINFHYQALNLILLLPLALSIKTVTERKQFVQHFVRIFFHTMLFGLGAILPMISLIVWDVIMGLKNSNNIMDYFLIAQHRIYLPRRWLTFLFNFVPQFWSSLAGGYVLWGYIVPLVGLVMLLVMTVKKRVKKEDIALWMPTIIFIALLRYYKGELFTGYLVYLYPMIIVSTSWVFFVISKIHRQAVYVLLVFFFFTMMLSTFQSAMQVGINSHQRDTIYAAEILHQQYPNSSFLVYAAGTSAEQEAYGLSLLLDKYQGPAKKIGFCLYHCPDNYLPIIQTDDKIPQFVVDMESADINALNLYHWNDSLTWRNTRSTTVYKNIAEWWQDTVFISTFSLKQYIKERAGIFAGFLSNK